MDRRMAQEAMREQMDALMGINRHEAGATSTKFWDSSVCSDYLAGLCLTELFKNTRKELPACTNLHNDALKLEYEGVKETKDYGYESQLIRHLERTIAENDSEIQMNKDKMAEERAKPDVLAPEELRNVSQPRLPPQPPIVEQTSSEEVLKMMANVEKLAEDGKVEESMMLLVKTEELKKKEALEAAKQNNPSLDKDDTNWVSQYQAKSQQLFVCEICAAYLSIHDSDKSLANHFGGKLHLGYKKVREKLKEIQEFLSKYPDREKVDSDEKDEKQDERFHNRRDRSYNRDRERGRRDEYRDRRDDYRDRNADRDRDRDRYHDRKRRRSRSRSRERDRYRDRNRVRERDSDDYSHSQKRDSRRDYYD